MESAVDWAKTGEDGDWFAGDDHVLKTPDAAVVSPKRRDRVDRRLGMDMVFFTTGLLGEQVGHGMAGFDFEGLLVMSTALVLPVDKALFGE